MSHRRSLSMCLLLLVFLTAFSWVLPVEIVSTKRIFIHLGTPMRSLILPYVTHLRPKAHHVKILEQRVQPGLFPRQRNPELTEDHIIVSAFDQKGEEIISVYLTDPRLVRAEWEDTSGMLTTQNFYLNEVNFSVVLPNKNNIKNLKIYQVHWTGTEMLREFLGGVQLAFMTIGMHMHVSETVSPIRYNGDPANRVDLVILGDGYTQNELTKYSEHAVSIVNGFFDQEPFKEYANFFNVHRVDVISNESGADHPTKGITKDTALDASYGTGSLVRLLTVNRSKVNAILENSVPANQRDIVLVIVNDTEYGGSGGSIAVASVHSSAVELVLHEIGHSFGLLADEYDYGGTNCSNPIEPSSPNVTTVTDRNLLKWNVGGGPPIGWIELNTQIPTILSLPGIPGLYEGACYCSEGYFRPTYTSKMRSLFRPFEQINEEQLVKRIYNWVSPIDSFSPVEGSRIIAHGNVENFQVIVPQPQNHSLNVEWSIDGVLQGTEFVFTLDSMDFNQGSFTLEVKTEDPTSRVRHDPGHVLIDYHSWEILISGRIDAPLGFSGTKVLNRSLSQAEYINVLTWQPNPDNQDIVKYRIFQRVGNSLQVLAEVNAGENEYRHRNVQKTKAYDYCIVAVNDLDIEGTSSCITI